MSVPCVEVLRVLSCMLPFLLSLLAPALDGRYGFPPGSGPLAPLTPVPTYYARNACVCEPSPRQHNGTILLPAAGHHASVQAQNSTSRPTVVPLDVLSYPPIDGRQLHAADTTVWAHNTSCATAAHGGNTVGHSTGTPPFERPWSRHLQWLRLAWSAWDELLIYLQLLRFNTCKFRKCAN